MTAKMIRRVRIGRVLVEEWDDNGKHRVFFGGKPVPLSFDEALEKARQAPLLEMRNECRRLADLARLDDAAKEAQGD